MSKLKIIAAMSGGVDSSVAAALLARLGHDVVGVTLKLLPRGGEGFGCCGSSEDVEIAKRSAEKAGIPHYVLDYSPDFKKDVIDYFVNSYVSGETPNPCLACNRHIKFDKLMNFAKSIGATHLATGHYARIVRDESGTYRLFESADGEKDQSYVLYNFDQKGLSSTMFPVGDRPKSEIRQLAREFNLPNADKKDSQEICFVPKKDYRSFVKTQLAEGAGKPSPVTVSPGLIKNHAGETVGAHEGVAYYTVGQRRGLKLVEGQSTPFYVTKLDPNTNTVYIGEDREGLSTGMVLTDVNWIAGTAPVTDFSAFVKIRYKHSPVLADVHVSHGRAEVRFKQPQRAVTPGQAAVFYRPDERIGAREVLGGGKIAKPLQI